MLRFIDKELLEWKSKSRRKPLIIRGARQVGKTYTVKQFGKEHFRNFVLVDFERNPALKKIFDADLNPVRICRDIEIVLNIRITVGETLLFFDEIQEAPQAIMSLRYFYEEISELHVIAAGSLLEFALQSISFPVGRIQIFNMLPMSFPEFLIGLGYNEAANTALQAPQKLSETVHDFLMKQVRQYFFVGGMPESVLVYRETKSIKEAQEVQNEIINTFRLDFPKYKPAVDANCLDMVFTSIANGVGTQTKYSGLAQGFSDPTIKKAYEALRLAQLFYKVQSVNPPEYPPKAYISEKKFKSIFLDIGLMQTLCGMNAGDEYLEPDLLKLYKGMLAEQFVGQELLAAQSYELFYWSRQARNSLAEVDYLSQNQQKIIPVEVKSGTSGRLRSMHIFLENYKSASYGLVLSARPYDELTEQKLKFIPLYFAFALDKVR